MEANSLKQSHYDFFLGVWIDSNYEVMYALASKITFICQMDFNAFPVDIQVFLSICIIEMNGIIM